MCGMERFVFQCLFIEPRTELTEVSCVYVAMTVESVLISIRTNMVVGRGRIDFYNKTDYTAREAKVAFDRMMV